MKRSFTQLPGMVLKGFCMGAADVVPGVSGGTMAFILGIYRRLLEAIRAFDTKLARLLLRRDLHAALRHVDCFFLVSLGTGIFAALMFFTRVVPLPVLIRTHPELVYGLFFGLIAASIIVLLRSIGRLCPTDMIMIGAGAAVGLSVFNMVPVQTPETWWFVFLSGALAICAMILPGISGSFILLMLRKYVYVFDAVGRLDLAVLVPFAAGAVVGLMLFSRLLTWLLRHVYRQTLLVITGLLAGSLWVMWPFQERSFEVVRGKSRLIQSTPVWPQALDGTVLGAGALMASGALAVIVLHALGDRRLRSI